VWIGLGRVIDLLVVLYSQFLNSTVIVNAHIFLSLTLSPNSFASFRVLSLNCDNLEYISYLSKTYSEIGLKVDDTDRLFWDCPSPSWTFLEIPKAHLIKNYTYIAYLAKNSNEFSVKLIKTSVPFSSTSFHVIIPNPAKICSFTFPTPGTFLIGKLIKNLLTSLSLNSK